MVVMDEIQQHTRCSFPPVRRVEKIQHQARRKNQLAKLQVHIPTDWGLGNSLRNLTQHPDRWMTGLIGNIKG